MDCISEQSVGSLPSNYYLANLVKLVFRYVSVFVIGHCDIVINAVMELTHRLD